VQAVQVQAVQIQDVQVKQVKQVQSKPCKVYAVSTQNVSNSNRTLMVKNLPRDSTVEKLEIDLRSLFVVHGPIRDVYIPVNHEGQYTGTIKGFAKLQFHNADHAAKAIVQAVTKPITIRKKKLFIEYANQDR
jgi:RNA recognition motif-containing protein